MRFDFLSFVLMTVQIFCDVRPFGLLDIFQWFVTLPAVSVYQTTRHNISEDLNTEGFECLKKVPHMSEAEMSVAVRQVSEN
jgi:hypothetical protein